MRLVADDIDAAQLCRIATRYDKTVLSFESSANLATARL